MKGINKLKRKSLITALVATLVLLSTIVPTRNAAAQNPIRVFPGAMGFGTFTPAGRGGAVLYVTNLNDNGLGTLRSALTAQFPRTVVFKISGTITLASDIVVTSPFLTVAGQTAPGEGVQIRGAQIKIATHDVLIR
ncbi:MAG TPA: hypothetical protein VFH34_02170, partial [Anaerolineales bacterium]|nr:hypothetical protein [Anaerolineales bacterium]